MDYFEFINSVKICAGKDALDNLPYELDFNGCVRPLIISDAGIKKAGVLDTVLQILQDNDVDTDVIFTDVPPDSSVEIINKITTIYRQESCDGIVAIGGGSVIDTAKGTRMLLSQSGQDLLELSGNEILKKGRHVPFLVLPTTCGTGSECTSVAVIKNHDTGIKMEFISSELLPDVAFIDSRLTKTLPPKLVAASAMDALVHSIEAYSSLQKNPLSDAYAITAIKLIVSNLYESIQNPSDKNRLNLAIASTMAGIAFSNSMVGIVHAIGHACGGECNVPHGNAMAILLPECMQFNLDECKEEYSELLLYLAGKEIYSQTQEPDRPKKAIEYIRTFEKRLNELCGLPLKLSEYGVAPKDLNNITEKALNDGSIVVNRKNVSAADILTILQKCL